MSLVHNEQTKLTATALNNVGVAFMIGGFVAPIIAVSMRAPSPPSDEVTILFSLIWLLIGFCKAHPDEAPPMTLLQAYVVFGLPLIAPRHGGRGAVADTHAARASRPGRMTAGQFALGQGHDSD